MPTSQDHLKSTQAPVQGFQSLPRQTVIKDKQTVIDRSKKSLFYLSHKVLGFKDVNRTTHGDIIDLLECSSTRKLICVPRGCLKSSLACVAYPIWLLINNPNLRILIDSELFTNSVTFIREIKGHFKSQRLQYLFGDLEGQLWSQSEIIIKSRTRNLKEASIVAGGIGTTKVGQHFDVIIADDLNSPQNTNSIENANKVVEHYRYNVSILEPTGTYVVIGTRYSSNDVIGHILANEPNDHTEVSHNAE